MEPPPTPRQWPDVAREARLDAYRATIRGIPYDAAIDAILSHAGPAARYVRKGKDPGRPKLAVIERQDDTAIGIRYEATRNDLYIDLQGPDAPSLIAACIDLAATYSARDPWPQCFRTNRIDGAIDIDEPGAFDRAVAHARATHAALYGHMPSNRQPHIDQRGDWDNPVKGRTLYIGSRDTNLLRIYEKGKQLHYVKGVTDASPHHIRIEVESHPADAAAFDAHTWPALQVLGTNRIAIAVIGEMLGSFPTFTASRDHGTRSPTARKLIALRNAYGPLFWDLTRRYDSAEAAARTLVAALSASQLTPESAQRLTERSVSAPELQDILGLGYTLED